VEKLDFDFDAKSLKRRN